MRRYALLPILSIFILCNTNVLYAESNKITLTGVEIGRAHV